MSKNIPYDIYLGEGKQLTDSILFFRDENVVKEFLDSLSLIVDKLPSKIKILEIGSGTGILGISVDKYLKKLGFETEIILSDRNILDVQNYKAEVVNLDNKSLPFGDEFFDLVISRSVTHYEKNNHDETLVLKEIKRVLKPNGIYLTQSLYIENDNEVALHQDINSIISKSVNIKKYQDVVNLHGNVFSKVDIICERAKNSLLVDRQTYLNRYGLNALDGDKILKKIKKFKDNQIPNFWIEGNNFGWKIDYLILSCKK